MSLRRTSSSRRGPRLLALLALAGAAVAGGLFGRRKLSGSDQPSGDAHTDVPPPQPANYDLSGPAANTATHVPAPEPQIRPETGGIDEEAEVKAAEAEAAAIGGKDPVPYTGSEGEPADEAERPLAEAGEGESEGQEQAEALLAENATDATSEGKTDAERQIEETIEQADDPAAGEQVEPLRHPDEPEAKGSDADDEYKTWSGRAAGSD